MKKYFAEMQHLNNPKNKSEEAVQTLARTMNRTLIHGEHALEQYVKQFRQKVDETNTKFPRCRYIDTEFRKYENQKTMWVSAHDVARIDFSEVETEFPVRTHDWGRDLMGDMKADAS